MNKQQLLAQLKPLISSGEVLDRPYLQIGTQLQTADANTIVFYRLRPGGQPEEVLATRLAEAKDCLLIVNRTCPAVKKRPNTLVISDDHFFQAQQILCDLLYPKNNKLLLAGVTGTNGKTTTVNLACQIANACGKRALALGTLGLTNEAGEIIEDLQSTTPSYVELRRLIHQYQQKIDVLFMEVSSHALEQNRLGEMKLAVTCWTSFSQDHLDYHSTMEQYFKAKCKLFQESSLDSAPCYIPSQLVPLFDAVSAKEKLKVEEVSQWLKDLSQLSLSFKPRYNRDNLALAFSLNEFLWGQEFVRSQMIKQLELLKPPAGRFSVIPYGQNLVVIDYAHTPDALENICLAIREAFPKHELITVFGCGGNRDRTKRPLMGAIAEKYSDYVIVTSDNPRYEDPEAIIDDIVQSMKGNYERHSYRRQAIRQALSMLSTEQIVLIAGKGHEQYQEVKGIKRFFSDFEEVKVFMGEKSV